MVRRESFYFIDAPKMMVVNGQAGNVLHRISGRRITLVGEFTITVNGLIAASCEFLTHGCFPGSGTSFDEEVSFSHGRW